MVYYHSTSKSNAESILAGGFIDNTDTYLTRNSYTGVWIADRPLDENEGACGEVLLAVELPDSLSLDSWEWVEEGKGYREWLVPAEILNRQGTVRMVADNTDWR